MFHTPSLMACGPAQVISPDGSHEVPASVWGDYAAIVLLDPDPPLMADWVRRLEEGLGVNEAHRKALEFSPQEVVASIRLDQEARGLRSTGPEFKVHLPDAERGRGASDLKMLDRLNKRLAANDYKPRNGKTAAELREDDLRDRQNLETIRAQQTEEHERDLGILESERLAEGRGEEVDVEKSGVRRIVDRDPLLCLVRGGHLTIEQFDTGKEIADLYEARSQDLGAMEYTGMPSGAHDHEKFVAKRFVRAKASEMIGRVERAVAINCSAEPVCLAILRVVCERGLTVRSQGGGRNLDRNYAALARALDVAEPVLRRQA